MTMQPPTTPKVEYFVEVNHDDERKPELVMASIPTKPMWWLYRFDRANKTWTEDPGLANYLSGMGGADSINVRALTEPQADKIVSGWGGSLPDWQLDGDGSEPPLAKTRPR